MYFAGMNLTLREATREDAVLIADLSRQTFYDTFAADNTKADMDKFMNEQFTRGRLILEVGAPENSFFLAFAEGMPAGYVKLREGRAPAGLKERDTLEIARLYAAREHIGAGVGRLLMEQSIAVARQRGKAAVWLGVWEKNERAIAFYRRWGFEHFGNVDFLLGDDVQQDWLMVRWITEGDHGL